MEISKTEILKKICYSRLVYGRINKKLHKSFLQKEIEKMIFDILCEAPISQYLKKGKNIYVTHPEKNIRITINSGTYRVITVDLLSHVLRQKD